jgi:hypothetical protein
MWYSEYLSSPISAVIAARGSSVSSDFCCACRPPCVELEAAGGGTRTEWALSVAAAHDELLATDAAAAAAEVRGAEECVKRYAPTLRARHAAFATRESMVKWWW